jgi:hypothetical protein
VAMLPASAQGPVALGDIQVPPAHERLVGRFFDSLGVKS